MYTTPGAPPVPRVPAAAVPATTGHPQLMPSHTMVAIPQKNTPGKAFILHHYWFPASRAGIFALEFFSLCKYTRYAGVSWRPAENERISVIFLTRPAAHAPLTVAIIAIIAIDVDHGIAGHDHRHRTTSHAAKGSGMQDSPPKLEGKRGSASSSLPASILTADGRGRWPPSPPARSRNVSSRPRRPRIALNLGAATRRYDGSAAWTRRVGGRRPQSRNSDR